MYIVRGKKKTYLMFSVFFVNSYLFTMFFSIPIEVQREIKTTEA